MSTSINLKEYIESLSYTKQETWTQTEITTEILEEISKITLFEVVSELPTTNIRLNRLYLKLNELAQTENLYDIYLYVNNRWEKLDSLELKIGDYYKATEVDALLAEKEDSFNFLDKLDDIVQVLITDGTLNNEGE